MIPDHSGVGRSENSHRDRSKTDPVLLVLGPKSTIPEITDRLGSIEAEVPIRIVTRPGDARRLIDAGRTRGVIVWHPQRWSKFLAWLEQSYPSIPVLWVEGSPSRDRPLDTAQHPPAATVVDDPGTVDWDRIIAWLVDRVPEEGAATVDVDGELARLASALAVQLTETRDSAEIERLLCREFAKSELFQRAWIGELDPTEGGITIRVAAGMLPIDGKLAMEWRLERLVREALETGTVRSGKIDPLTRNYVIPLDPPRQASVGTAQPVSDRQAQSVLVVAADESFRFDSGAETVLRQLGQAAAGTLHGAGNPHIRSSTGRAQPTPGWAIEAVPMGMVVFDSNGTIRSANHEARRWLGKSDSEAATSKSEPNIFEVLELETDGWTGFSTIWRQLKRGQLVRAQARNIGGSDNQPSAEAIVTRIPGHPLIPTDGESTGLIRPDPSVVEEPDIGICFLITTGVPRTEDITFASATAFELDRWVSQIRRGIDRARRQGERYHFDAADNALVRMMEVVNDELSSPHDGFVVDHLEAIPINWITRVAWNHVYEGFGTLHVTDNSTILADKSLTLRLFEHLFRHILDHADGEVIVRVTTENDRIVLAVTGTQLSAGAWNRAVSKGTPNDRAGYDRGMVIMNRIILAHGWWSTAKRMGREEIRFEIGGVNFKDR